MKNTQINLDHYRETVRKTREIENNLLNDKIKNLEKQLYQQQVTITKATEEITALLRNNKLLEEIKQTTLQDLNANLIKFQEQKNVIQNQIAAHNELNTKYNNILSDKAELANELKAEKVAIINLRVSLEKAQERILMCEFILEKTETKLATVSDKKYPFSYVDYKKAI